MTVVLKLGGSVITEKDTLETVDDSALDGAVEAIAASSVAKLVVVHGAGSFGHPRADAHGISRTEGSHDAAAVVDIHGAMKRLNEIILGRFHDRGVPALPVHPLSSGYRDADASFSLLTEQVKTMLDEGFVPVLHGDVIAHAGRGATIVSGDEVVVSVAEALSDPETRVGLCSGVPGVLDADGSVIPRIYTYEAVADVLGESDATDVTGGMAQKVRTLLALDAPATIFGPDDLEAFLAGDSPGTRIDRE